MLASFLVGAGILLLTLWTVEAIVLFVCYYAYTRKTRQEPRRRTSFQPTGFHATGPRSQRGQTGMGLSMHDRPVT